MGVDPPQRVQPRPGPAASVGRRRFRDGSSRTPTPCSPTSSRERLRRWAFPTNGCGRSTRVSCSPRAARSAPPDRGATRMGYGPLVRATTGVTWLWTSEDAPPGSFYDATTIFPDHVVGQDHRDRRAGGAHRPGPHRNRCARAHLAGRSGGQPARDRLRRRGRPRGRRFRWSTTRRCMRSIRATATTSGASSRCGPMPTGLRWPRRWARDALPSDRADFIAAVSEWTAQPGQGRRRRALQRAGVPAAPMNRAVDVSGRPADRRSERSSAI